MAVLHMQLRVILPFCLQRSVRQHYGLSMEDALQHLPIPYSASNTPTEKSSFANRWTLVNFACIMYIQGHFQRHLVTFVRMWQHRLQLELSQNDDFKAIHDEARTVKEWHQICPDVALLDALKSTKRQEVLECINGRHHAAITARLNFIRSEVLSKMSTFSKQIVGTTQSLAMPFRSLQGYSGTLPNHFIFPRSVTIVEDAEQRLEQVRKALVEGKHNDNVFALSSSATEITAESLLKAGGDPMHYKALIDVGAYCKKFTNQEFATFC